MFSRLGLIMMVCAGIFIGVVNNSYAQYSGPGASGKTSTKDKIKSALGVEETGQETVTVRKLKRDPIYDEEIVLKGKITKKTGTKEYQFEDDTGKMKMIIEDKLFLMKKISETTTVEVTGVATKKERSKDLVFNAIRLKVVK